MRKRKQGLNKSQFIRERISQGKSNKEIVAEAAEAGAVLTSQYVSVIRSNDKRKSGIAKASKAKKPVAKSLPASAEIIFAPEFVEFYKSLREVSSMAGRLASRYNVSAKKLLELAHVVQ